MGKRKSSKKEADSICVSLASAVSLSSIFGNKEGERDGVKGSSDDASNESVFRFLLRFPFPHAPSSSPSSSLPSSSLAHPYRLNKQHLALVPANAGEILADLAFSDGSQPPFSSSHSSFDCSTSLLSDYSISASSTTEGKKGRKGGGKRHFDIHAEPRTSTELSASPLSKASSSRAPLPSSSGGNVSHIGLSHHGEGVTWNPTELALAVFDRTSAELKLIEPSSLAANKVIRMQPRVRGADYLLPSSLLRPNSPTRSTPLSLALVPSSDAPLTNEEKEKEKEREAEREREHARKRRLLLTETFGSKKKKQSVLSRLRGAVHVDGPSLSSSSPLSPPPAQNLFALTHGESKENDGKERREEQLGLGHQ